MKWTFESLGSSLLRPRLRALRASVGWSVWWTLSLDLLQNGVNCSRLVTESYLLHLYVSIIYDYKRTRLEGVLMSEMVRRGSARHGALTRKGEHVQLALVTWHTLGEFST